MSTELTLTPQRIALVTSRLLIYGAVVCIFSLNAIFRVLGGYWQGTRTSGFLFSIAAIPDAVYGSIRGGPYLIFELLLRWVLFLLAAYFVLIILTSIRHRSPIIFASGLSGFAIGLFAFTWLSILVLILYFLVTLIGWIFDLIRFVVLAILSFLLWAPVFYTLLALIAIPIVLGLISLVRGVSFRELWRACVAWLRNMSARPIVFVVGIIGLALFVWFVGVPLWEYYIAPILSAIREWLLQYVVPLLSWIISVVFSLIFAIIAVAMTVAVLCVLGWQFSEQFLTARQCGRNTHSLFGSGFAIGAVIGLTLLICLFNPDFRELVNVCWHHTSPVLPSMDLSAALYMFMPSTAEGLLQPVFSKASIPIFDVAALVATLLLANCSLLTSLVSSVTVEPLRELLQGRGLPPLGKVLFGFLIMIGVGVAGALSEDS